MHGTPRRPAPRRGAQRWRAPAQTVNRVLMVLIVLGAAALVAAATGRYRAAAGAEDDALVRVVHAIPDAPAVAVLLDGGALVERIAYGEARGYLRVAPGHHRLGVALDGEPPAEPRDFPLVLAPGSVATVVLVGLVEGGPDVAPLVLDDDPDGAAADVARVRFVHVAVRGAAADLTAGDGPALHTGIAYGDRAEAALAAGTYRLGLRWTETGAEPVAETSITVASGRVYTVLALGRADGTPAPALIVLDRPAPPRPSPTPAVEPDTPAATATAAEPALPLPSTTPLPVVRAPGAVILSETFEDPGTGALPASSPEPSRFFAGYLGGEYVIRRLAGTQDPTSRLNLPGEYADVAIAVDARLVGGAADRHVFAGCRYSATPAGTNAYRLLVYPQSGEILIARYDGGRRTVLARRTLAVARRGEGTSRLVLTCAGNAISASVNGTPVASVSDATYRTGQVYIGVGVARDTLGAEARFDNLLMTQQ